MAMWNNPSISMDHLYHGYVSHNQRVNTGMGKWIAGPKWSKDMSKFTAGRREQASVQRHLQCWTRLDPTQLQTTHNMGLSENVGYIPNEIAI